MGMRSRTRRKRRRRRRKLREFPEARLQRGEREEGGEVGMYMGVVDRRWDSTKPLIFL